MSIYAPVYSVNLQDLPMEELRAVYRIIVGGLQELLHALQEQGAL